MKVLIDGSFVEKKPTGVGRFCWEVLKHITKYTDGVEWYIAIPNSTDDTKLKEIDNLTIIKEGKKNNKKWQLLTLGKIAKKMGAYVLGMANFTPLFKKDFIILHDVTYLDKEGQSAFLWSLKYRIIERFGMYKHKNILTVSEFSKGRIKFHYKKYPLDKIVVIGNAGDHWDGVESVRPSFYDDSEYFLSVSSTTKNKNFKYVVELAKKNPTKNFIIVGRIDNNLDALVGDVKNLKFTGYISNEELRYLYEHCKAFILPSLYEGFGMPPLEALYCGTKCLILSNIDVFKETYGDNVNYCNPYDYENLISLDDLKNVPDEKIKEIFDKYNWNVVSKRIYDAIIKYNK